jgi:hypothetical protein
MERTKISYLTVFRKCQGTHTAKKNDNAVDKLPSIPTVIQSPCKGQLVMDPADNLQDGIITHKMVYVPLSNKKCSDDTLESLFSTSTKT